MPALERMSRRSRAWVLFAALAVVFARSRGRIRRYEIAESSMQPALLPGDYVIATRHDTSPLLGDVVVTPHPDRPGFDLVKRVIGLPGQTVTIADGRVQVDGAPLPEPWATGPTRPDGEWALRHAVFLLGDRRLASSADSRTIGPVPMLRVRWRIVFRYWPLDRIGLLRPGSGRTSPAATE